MHDVVLPGTLPAAARRTDGGTLQSGTDLRSCERTSCMGGGVERSFDLALFSEGVQPESTGPTQAHMEAGSGLSSFKPPFARTVSTVLMPASTAKAVGPDRAIPASRPREIPKQRAHF